MFHILVLFAVLTLASPSTAASAPAAVQPAATASPDAIAGAFFKTLQGGDVAKAYAEMWRGALMSKKQADVENLVNQTEVGLKYYGKVLGWELIEAKSISTSYIESIYLLRTDVGPLFFKMYFYHSPNGWQVNNFNFSDSYKTISQ